MAIFKRGGKYYYNFWWNGQHVQKSSRQGNREAARTMEANHRTALAKAEAGIIERPPAPLLSVFAKKFRDEMRTRHENKPNTVTFYLNKLARLLEFPPLAKAPLDKIDEALIAGYVRKRAKQPRARATINRELATLRRALRLAQEWRIIDRVPRVHLLPGENEREFVLNYDQERDYLATAPQPLADAALLLLDTGLRLSELLALEWRDVHLKPAAGAKRGYVHVRFRKTRNAKRNVSLTAQSRTMLQVRLQEAKSRFVFTNETGSGPLSKYTLEDQHRRTRAPLKLDDCVIHSFRHTFGTRLGEAGADAFTIMKVMGHSTVTVSQKYVHPTPEAQERAIARLEALNERAKSSRAKKPTAIPTTAQRLKVVGES